MSGLGFLSYASLTFLDDFLTFCLGLLRGLACAVFNVFASFFAGLEYCRAGNYVSDISHAVQQRAEADGFGVIRDYVGHGVGRDLHEDPSVPNYGRPGRGAKLRKGMVIAIEPMISEGSYEVDLLDDGWGAVTKDRKLAAHYENTVVITDGDPEVITLLDGE